MKISQTICEIFFNNFTNKPILILDSNKKVKYCNGVFKRKFGMRSIPIEKEISDIVSIEIEDALEMSSSNVSFAQSFSFIDPENTKVKQYGFLFIDQKEYILVFNDVYIDNTDSQTIIRLYRQLFSKMQGHELHPEPHPINIIEKMDVSIIVLSRDSRVVDANAAALKMFGYSKQEITLLEMDDICYGNQAAVTEFIITMKNRGMAMRELQLIHKSGSIKWVNVHAVMVNADQYMCYCQDITSQVKAQKELLHKQTSFYSLINNMDQGMALYRLIADNQGKPINYVYEDINGEYKRIFGFVGKDVIGKLATQVHGNVPYLEEFSEAVRTGKPKQFESFCNRTNRYFQFSVTPTGNMGVGCLVLNITRQKRSAILLDALNEAAINMQSAQSIEQIFDATASALQTNNLKCMLKYFDDIDSQLFHSFNESTIETIRKQLGLQKDYFCDIVEKFKEMQRVVVQKETVFVQKTKDELRNALPYGVKDQAQMVVEALKISSTIIAPLKINEAVRGVFLILSDGISDEDISAVTAYTNQMGAAIERVDLNQSLRKSILQVVQSEKELGRREKLLSKIFHTLPIGLWFADKDGRLQDANPVAKRIWSNELPGKMYNFEKVKVRRYPSGQAITADDWALSQTLNEGVTIIDEMLEIETLDNERKIIMNYSAPFHDDFGEIDGAIIINQDITSRIEAEEEVISEKELLQTTLTSIGDGVIVTDHQGKITIINAVFEQLSGWTQQEAYGKRFEDIVQLYNESSGKRIKSPVERVIKTGQIVALANHTVLVSKNGKEIPVADSAAPIKDAHGHTHGVVLVIRDVTAERDKRNEINYLVYHDSLTGLYNRRFLDEQIKIIDIEENLPISVISCDVNGLKLTNDALGHDRGDDLLKKMAETINKACRNNDIVVRSGGDEFFVLLPKTDEEHANLVCDRITSLVLEVKMDAVEFSLAVGYDTKKNVDEDILTVMKRAEDYMYRRKSYESPSMRGNSINTILSTLHEKSPREREHSKRVGEICKQIGHAMNMSDTQIDELYTTGLMHDIGKITIDEHLLNKPDVLTDEEWLEFRRHPEIGFRILRASTDMKHIADNVLAHHERWNGTGYPNGLREEEIPMIARIVAVADAYDALLNDRPYRKAVSQKEAVQNIIDRSRVHFDPQVVDAFRLLFDGIEHESQDIIESHTHISA